MEVVKPSIKAAAIAEQETEIPDMILKSINTGKIFIAQSQHGADVMCFSLLST
jgi:hypothetical protein